LGILNIEIHICSMVKYNHTLFFLLLASQVLISCGDAAKNQAVVRPSYVGATAYVKNTDFTVTLSAEYSSANFDRCGFYYGMDPELRQNTNKLQSDRANPFTISLIPDSYDTVYYYRSFISDSFSETNKEPVESFRTLRFADYVRITNPSVESFTDNSVTVSYMSLTPFCIINSPA